jgi:hypothetical protein
MLIWHSHANWEGNQERKVPGQDTFGKIPGPERVHDIFSCAGSRDSLSPIIKVSCILAHVWIRVTDSILKKVYYKNALRIIPNIDSSGFPE